MKASTVIIAGATALLTGAIAIRGGGTDNVVSPPAPIASASPAPALVDPVAALEKSWMDGNDLCRGSYDEKEARVGCVKREKADAKLKKLGWCFEYSDWRVFPTDYDWHRCSQARPANFVPDPRLEPAPPPPPRATAASYDALKPGMTLAQAETIMGFKGDEKVASYIGYMETKMVTWQNPDGGNVSVEFQNGVLIMKAQYGLR